LKVWAEGSLFMTGGGTFNVPALPGGLPAATFSPRTGIEGALGFDYRWDRSWHFVFDIRYGRSSAATRNSSGPSTTATFTTFSVPLPSRPPFSGFRVNNQTDSTTARTTQRESHFVADFMIGRDLGLGTFRPDLQFGLRIADLRAAAKVQINNQSIINSTTFYTPSVGPIEVVAQTTTTTSTTAFATWKSRFFGIGPRAAIAGGIPISGAWTFDYGGGIAGLVGHRSFKASISTGGFLNSQSGSAFVFNVDAMAALSYAFSTQYKASGGVRGDYYHSALSTFNVTTGALSNIDRVYWGPFVRLTGAF
jgi:hypothetical protein